MSHKVNKKTLQATIISIMLLAVMPALAGYPAAPFNFQGQLKQVGIPVNDTCDFSVGLFEDASGGTAMRTSNRNNVAVVEGLFNIALDFGSDLFDGSTRYLEVTVECGGGAPVLLTPRTPILPTPMSIQTRGLYVDSAGEIGIGTDDPDADMHFVSTSSLQLRLEADTNNSGESDQPSILMSQDGGIITGSIGFFDQQNSLSLRTGDTGAGLSHLLLIPKGSVGVGVESNLNTGKLVVGQDLDTVNHGLAIFDSSDGQSLRLWVDADSVRRIDAGGNGQATLALNAGGAGNVGIGTTQPGAKLHVVTQSAGNSNNTAEFYAPNIGPIRSHVHFGATGDWYIRSADTSGKVLIQDSSGSVGIGTSSPEAKLHVKGPDNDGTTAPLVVESGGQRLLLDGNEIDAVNDKIHFNHNSSSDVSIAVGGGNVGVGTSAPNEKLHVNGNLRVTGDIITPTRTGFVSISPAGFNDFGNTRLILSVDKPLLVNTLNGVTFDAYATVQLPHGARVTEFRALVEDTSPGADQDIRILLGRTSQATVLFSSDTIAELESTVVGEQDLKTTAINQTNNVVNNWGYTYWVRFTDNFAAPSDTMYLRGVSIKYEVTEVLP